MNTSSFNIIENILGSGDYDYTYYLEQGLIKDTAVLSPIKFYLIEANVHFLNIDFYGNN
jgi:hypothetical protein